MYSQVSIKRVFLTLLLATIAAPAMSKEVVNIYSARHYDTDLTLYREFEAKTGIKVNLIEASSDALIERIANEGKYSPADILITVDAGRLYRAEQKGIFAPIESKILEDRIPEQFRHPENLWFGFSKRARIIIFNQDQGKPKNLNTYADLTRPEFKGQICVRSSSNIYNISLLASIVSHKGEAEAEKWAKGVVDNLMQRPQGNDTANIKSVAAGECKISIVNSYYLARMVEEKVPGVDKVGIVYPNQESTGTHVNISGAGVLKYAPNKANAVKFIEYLTEAPAQELLIAGNHEYPILNSAKATTVIEQLGNFKEDSLNASELGEHQATAVKIFDRVGWN
ncbi:Iron uptake protein A1 [Thalassocella blandensis]|nr:Iron uptake protein A1 [Thalassocella blandensis]